MNHKLFTISFKLLSFRIYSTNLIIPKLILRYEGTLNAIDSDENVVNIYDVCEPWPCSNNTRHIVAVLPS